MDLSYPIKSAAPASRAKAWDARPMDALGLITLLSSIYSFQVWALTQQASPMPAVFHAMMMAFSGAGILLPRLKGVLLGNALAFAVAYLLAAPVASNNQTTAFFFSLVVLGAILVSRSHGSSRDVEFDRIATVGRWLLPSMYFFGIYHKINTDFLDPAVSCAVVLYEALFDGTLLSSWRFGQYGAIYATFVVEAIAMIALFIPRLKIYGMMIGIPFHVIIGFTGYAYYKDFSTIVLVLYALFIPRSAYARAFGALTNWCGSEAASLRLGRAVLVAFVGSYVAFALLLTDRVVPTHDLMVPFFAVYCACFYIFAITCSTSGPDFGAPRRVAWLMLIPVLYFANGWSPYLGLKTEASIAMYSNLHTEGGETNHLIHGVLPGLWGYQNDLVTPVGSNSATFDQRYVGEGRALVRYELDRMLAEHPGLHVRLDTPEGVISTETGWFNTYLAAHPIAQKFLIFKPVDLSRPKVCTH